MKFLYSLDGMLALSCSLLVEEHHELKSSRKCVLYLTEVFEP